MALVCGIDEAGRGPVIGPMVLAGVLLDEKDEHLLKKLGVKDSKLIAPEKRELLYGKILEIVKDHCIITYSNSEIDEALGTINLNLLEAKASNEIILKLKPAKVILDCPSTNIRAYRANFSKHRETEFVVEHKADLNYISVAAASILAKVTRDREIDKLRAEYGDFGSGYCSDPKTKEFLEKNHSLPIYRRRWVTWQVLDEQKKQSRLDSFC